MDNPAVARGRQKSRDREEAVLRAGECGAGSIRCRLDMANNFLDLDPKHREYQSSRFAVLPVPYDATSSYVAGSREGPAAIISASAHLEDFDEELEVECHTAGITTLGAVPPNADGGEAMHRDIYRAAKRVVRDGKFLFALGGDHSITSALVRAVMAKHRKLSVLQIDAHLDLRDRYQGSKYSHACVMRRVHELGAGARAGVTIVPVGTRSVCLEEHRFLKRAGIVPVTARMCHMEDDWVDRVLNRLGDTVYVTIDVDGFDPSFAPGTGTPEPGGLDFYQVTGLLRLLAAEKTIVGADIVEVMPIPGQVVTEYLAARLAYKLMCYVHARE